MKSVIQTLTERRKEGIFAKRRENPDHPMVSITYARQVKLMVHYTGRLNTSKQIKMDCRN